MQYSGAFARWRCTNWEGRDGGGRLTTPEIYDGIELHIYAFNRVSADDTEQKASLRLQHRPYR